MVGDQSRSAECPDTSKYGGFGRGKESYAKGDVVRGEDSVGFEGVQVDEGEGEEGR